MTFPGFWNTEWLAELANHLWQSTVVVLAAWLLTLMLRRNRARTRYCVWMIASLKFLAPFSLLIAAGSRFSLFRGPAWRHEAVSVAVERVSQTFLPATATPGAGGDLRDSVFSLPHPLAAAVAFVWAGGFLVVLLLWGARRRQVSCVLRRAVPLGKGREVEALRRMERIAGIQRPTEMLVSTASLEPGIFGILRPVLLWPAMISERFSQAQLEAVLAHELGHIRRRDNLVAAVHMLVEALFWFHPLVWWLGAQLVEERERACDETVLEFGSARQAYAESILKTCEFCVGSPLPCVAGVTGSGLKKRIVRIMSQPVARELSRSRKLLLTAIAVAVIAGPVIFGLMKAPRALAQLLHSDAPLPSFEVASIKPDKGGEPGMRIQMLPGGFKGVNISTKMLIEFAFDIKSEDQIVGGPGWLNSDKYDIDAKVDEAIAEKMKNGTRDQASDQLRLMVQAMLAERFNLKVSRETQDLPVYALVIAKGGSKLSESKLPALPPPASDPSPPPSGPQNFRGIRMSGPGRVEGAGATMGFLSNVLSRQAEVGHVVIDETGLKGIYDRSLKWTPEPALGGAPGGPQGGPNATAPPEADGPSLFTAVQEQLGLKLESRKEPAEVLVIDRIEKPSEN